MLSTWSLNRSASKPFSAHQGCCGAVGCPSLTTTPTLPILSEAAGMLLDKKLHRGHWGFPNSPCSLHQQQQQKSKRNKIKYKLKIRETKQTRRGEFEVWLWKSNSKGNCLLSPPPPYFFKYSYVQFVCLNCLVVYFCVCGWWQQCLLGAPRGQLVGVGRKHTMN